MSSALIHADEIDTSVVVGHNVHRMSVLNLLTDANVAAASTVDELIANIETNKDSLHVDADWSTQGERALTIGEALADITDAVVAASSTVQQLVDATQAGSDGLSQSMMIE